MLAKELEKYALRVSRSLKKANYKFADGTEKSGDEALAYIVRGCELASARSNKLMFIGNGGSAAIASHMAIDYSNAGKIRAVCFNDGALLTCLGNDYGFENIFSKAIEIHARQGDVLFAISSSGKSQDILNGVKEAKEKYCLIVTLSGFKKDNELARLGDINIYIPSSSYGIVEVSHYFILHCILDHIASKKPA